MLLCLYGPAGGGVKVYCGVKTSLLLVDFSRETKIFWEYWGTLWEEVANQELHPLPPQKVFKPKCELPVLKEYNKAAPGEFWDAFPSNLVQPAKSSIDHVRLKQLALEIGFKNLVLLDTVCKDLESGAGVYSFLSEPRTGGGYKCQA